ncbi:Cdc6/Cdc18 family protein [Haloglomus litoreum]|uniref:Cdc6/Cdc18 family protein n=1 Tax=Haloglomus litoreum TaxID=3034026 RepID=UPI0023E7558B|nr:Cdc6/Cdc18 family protein [Haloglomus sp. DT116]
MIRDARVLDPEFVPRDIVHRDAEVNALSNALDPITEGEHGKTTFLFGPSGTGKTCIARYTVEQLREAVIDITTQYINCWQNYSRFRVLYEILSAIGRTVDIHRQSTPADLLLERIQNHDGSPYVIVLDEVDQLEDKDVLYDLYMTRGISIVMIANREEDLFAQLDERLVSRLHASRRIRFERYGMDDLVAILQARVDRGLTPDAIDDEDLRFIADAAAGDARIAIATLREAARTADRDGLTHIPSETVREALPNARETLQQKSLDRLKPHQRTLYEIIEECGEIDPGELYGQYQERTSSPKSKRTIRKYLQKLAAYDLIVAEGEKRGRTYRLSGSVER